MSQLEAPTPRLDYRATWRARVLGIVATGALFGIAAATSYFAANALDDFRFREGRTYRVGDPTWNDPGLSDEERRRRSQLWYGSVYELPPGVSRGGLLATLSGSIICTIVGGIGIFMTLCVTHSVSIDRYADPECQQ